MKTMTATLEFGILLYLTSMSSYGTDVVLLESNESLSGTVLNETFQVRTPYANVRLDSSVVKQVELNGTEGGAATIRTFNGTRITGHLDDSVVLLRSETGDVVEIAREKVLRVTYGARRAVPYEETPRNFFVMKNGDYFSGPIHEESLAVAVSAEAAAGSLRDMRSISVEEKSDRKTWIAIGKGNEIQGLLDIQDIAVALEASPNIKIYEDRGATGRVKGRVSGGAVEDEPLRLIRLGDRRMVGYCVNNTQEGVRIRNVTSGLPASLAGLQVGDWVVNIDGRPIGQGNEVWTVRDEIIACERQHLLMELRRGEKTRWYLLVK